MPSVEHLQQKYQNNRAENSHQPTRLRERVMQAKLDDFTFHDLRHTFATRLADRGVPQSAIKEMLGQTSLKMSWRYTHAVIETMRGAVEKLCEVNAAACPIFPPETAEESNESVAA